MPGADKVPEVCTEVEREMTSMGASMLEGSFDERMKMPDPIINVLVFFDKLPTPQVITQAFEEHLWPSPRFHSCMADGGYWVGKHTQMDRAYHVQQCNVNDEAGITAYVQVAMMQPLDPEHPPWNVVMLEAPPPSRSAIWMRVHHTVGDGLGLLFAFSPMMDCEGGNALAKVPLPNVLLPKSLQRQPAQRQQRQGACVGDGPGFATVLQDAVSSAGLFFEGLLNPLLVKADSELMINAPLQDRTPFLPYNGQRVYAPFPAVSMSAVKAVREKHEGSTVNDVLLAALTGALRRYDLEVRGDARLQEAAPGTVECKTMLMMGLPRKLDEEDLVGSLRNKILFASCPLPIDEPTATGRLERTVQACGRLKSASFMTGLSGVTDLFTKSLPSSMLRKTASESFSKHTLLVTTVPGFSVPVTWPKQGQIVREIQMVFPNCIPQVSIVTYNGTVCGNIVADPELFPKVAELGKYCASEFEALAAS